VRVFYCGAPAGLNASVEQKRRGLRVPFSAPAEVAREGSQDTDAPAKIVELSLHGCFMEFSQPFAVQTKLRVKIFKEDEYFEAQATVMHVRDKVGMGLAFWEIKPHFLGVLQKWILAAMLEQKQAGSTVES
jgi:hypothetical protein